MYSRIFASHCFSFINRFLDSNVAMGNDFVQYISEVSNDLHKKSIPLRASLFNYAMLRRVIRCNGVFFLRRRHLQCQMIVRPNHHIAATKESFGSGNSTVV